MKKNKAGVGRPKEKVLPKVLAKLNDPAILERMASKLTDLDLADILGIPLPTFKKYKRDEEFLASIKKGLDQRAEAVHNALLRRAIGFFYDEVMEELVPVIVGKNGKKGYILEQKMVVTKRIKKFVMSDIAAIFLLRNYKPELFNKKYGDSGDEAGNEGVNINILYTDNQKENTNQL